MNFINYLDAIQSADGRNKKLTELHEWLQSFICRPHPDLGRSGDVCPYVSPSLDQRRILLTHYDLPNDKSLDKRKLMGEHLLRTSQEFKDVTSSEEGSLDCLIVIISGISTYEWRYIMDGSYKDVKAEILEKKLMVGCFYPLYNRPSLRNRNFFPMRPPIPIFAFRHMVRFDKASLKENDLYVKIYENFYPPKDS